MLKVENLKSALSYSWWIFLIQLKTMFYAVDGVDLEIEAGKNLWTNRRKW